MGDPLPIYPLLNGIGLRNNGTIENNKWRVKKEKATLPYARSIYN